MKILGGVAFGVLVSVVACFTSRAQGAEFPLRPVTIVVPSNAGGPTDILSRVIANRLSQKWGKPVVIENKTGANSIIGESYVANSAPDGHTILITNAGRAVNAATNAPDSGYDMVNGFAAITQVGTQAQILVSTKFKTMPEMMEFAKKNPNKVTYGDAGPGSPNDLAMKLLMQKTGTQIFEISYRNQADALLGAVKGEIDVVQASLLLLAPQITSGAVNGLAITSRTRSPALPQLPTVSEALGVDFEFYGWYGFFAPAKTPKDVVDKLSADIGATLQLPEVKDPLAKDGFQVVASKPDEFEKVLKEEILTWTQVLKAFPPK